MARWERFQLDVPDDFPLAELDAVHAQLSDMRPDAPQTNPDWAEWAGASNGIVYRYIACDEHATDLADSLGRDLSPPQPERYRQERLLFSFFTEGLSCVECFYYGLYFAGAMIDPVAFVSNVNRRAVTPGRVVQAYQSRFPFEQVTVSMWAVNVDASTNSWREARNVLAHRASPGRQFYEGGALSGRAHWLGESLSGDLIRARRTWLADTMQTLLSPAVGFVQQHYV
jgi:hypothetical protein